MIDNMTRGTKTLPYANLFFAGAALMLIAKAVVLRLGETQTLMSTCLWCFLATALGFMFDRLIIYPYCRSAIRHSFPTVFVRFRRHHAVAGTSIDNFLQDDKLFCYTQVLSSLIESPRGKTALSWFKEFPEDDAIHIYDPLLGDIVVPISPCALRDALSTNSRDYIKPEASIELLATVGGKSLVFTSGIEYTKFRKAIHPLFSLRTVRKTHEISWDKSDLLSSAIIDRGMDHGFHDPWPVLFRFVLDSVGEGFLSYDFDSMRSGWHNDDVRALQRTLTPGRRSGAFIAASLFTPPGLLLSLPTRNIKSLKEVSRQLRTISSQILNSAKSMNDLNDPAPEDLLRSLVAKGDLNDEEAIETILTFLTAGIETTSAALTWTLHLLTLPECIKDQDELRRELHHKFFDIESRAVNLGDLESIPILHGIIEESLRLFPPIPLLCHEAYKDTKMMGRSIPRGTRILYCMWALNRNPNYWGSDADAINPYRWISTDEHGTHRLNKHGGASSNYCYESFLNGPRACVGKDASKATMRAAIAKLVSSFEISRDANDGLDLEIRGAVIMRPVEGLKLKFSRVQREHNIPAGEVGR
jgi:cytochrome P450